MSEDSDSLFREIALLAARQTGLDLDKIKPESRLFSDLGVDGVDAGAFMAAFAQRYEVDLTEFRYLRFFGDEGWDLLRPTLVWAGRLLAPVSIANGGRRWKRNVRLQSLTLSTLHKRGSGATRARLFVRAAVAFWATSSAL